MAKIAKGNTLEMYVGDASSIAFTPGSGGYIRFDCSSPMSADRPTKRFIYSSATIQIPAGSTVFAEAVGADATYIQSSVSGGGVPGLTRRPRLLVFGNSIAAQSGHAYDGVNNSGASDLRAGTTAFVSGSAQTISAGAQIAYRTYTGEPEVNTVASAVSASTAVPLTNKTARMVRASAAGTFTVFATQAPGNYRGNWGIVSAAIGMLGFPVEIVTPSYGYGGATIQQMVADLPMYLARTTPHYVALHLLENNMTTGETWASIKPWLCRAVEECLRVGAVPLVFSSVPSTTVNDVARSGVWDAQRAYVTGTGAGTLEADYPAARGIDVSSPWLDTAATTSRPPVSGIATDGIHPDGARRFYCANTVRAKLSDIFPSYIYSDRPMACFNVNPKLAGTGGATAGAGTQTGSVVAANYTSTAQSGVTAVLSKNADDTQKIQFAVPGASNISNTDLVLQCQSYSLPTNVGPTAAVRAYIKFRVNAQANMALFYPQLVMSGGESYSVGQNETNMLTDPTLIGKIITAETPAVLVPPGTTSMLINARLRPQTLVSPSGCTADIDVIEMGIEPAAVY